MYVAEQIDIRSIVGADRPITGGVKLSDDNRIAFAMEATANKYVVDLNAKVVEWVKPTPWYILPQLSPDGQYLFVADSVYIKQNGNWDTLLGRIPSDGVQNVAFRQDAKQHLVVNRGQYKGIFIYDLAAQPDGQGLLQAVDMPPVAGEYFCYDRYTSGFQIIKVSPGGYLGDASVYDVATFTLTRQVSTIYEPKSTLYVNGHFFHGSGAILP
jgi:hypothetical protein